jgi:RNA polymerase sigma-70 factor (ECF subfamily)
VRRDFRDDLDAALATLRPEFRRLIVLRYLEDMSYEDIAEVVGLPLGTVKSHLHRARAALGRLLAESGWGPDPPAGER